MNRWTALAIPTIGLGLSLAGCGAEQFRNGSPPVGSGGAGGPIDLDASIDPGPSGSGGASVPGSGGQGMPTGGTGGGDAAAGGSGGGGAAVDVAPETATEVRPIDPCAAASNPTLDTDGDGLPDCEEDGDGDPWTDRMIFNGLSVTVRANGSTGSCGDLGDYNGMVSRFQQVNETKNMYAGWSFSTDQDRYYDPAFGFKPNWTTMVGGSFRIRYRGIINLTTAGQHCFKVDVGSTGGVAPDSCGQVYVNSGPGSTFLVQNGYQATAGHGQGCVNLPAGSYPFDIVFQYGNANDHHALAVSYCAGGAAACTPNTPLTQAKLRPPTCLSSADCDCEVFGGHNYRFCKMGRAFAAAEASCMAQGGMHLARLDSDAENRWAFAAKQAKGMMTTWIGATDATTEGAWQWVDGTGFWSGIGAIGGGKPVAGLFNAWDGPAQEPNQTGDEDCGGYWYQTPTWADLTCTDLNAYICEAY
jgi:hypothetical protein